jgi:hypothetical protein
MCIDLSVKSRLGQNCQMFVSMRAKKPAGIKLQYFCQYGDRNKNQPKNKVKPESTTRFKNRSLDRMMMSD